MSCGLVVVNLLFCSKREKNCEDEIDYPGQNDWLLRG